MPRSFNIAHPGSHRLAGTLVAASILFSAGCLEEDKVAPALREASSLLESLGAPGTAVPGDEFRIAEYRNAIEILQEVSTQGSEAQNAAAALMIARAQMGLAEVPATELAAVNQRLYDLVAEVRGELGVWSSLNSLAETAASFNPDEDLARINTKIQERDAAIEAERTAAEAVRATVADLEGRAEQASSAASELRQQETELRQRANALEPREALPLHEQAASVRREADAFDMQAEKLMAEADTIRPEIGDHDLEIGRLTQQRDLLVTSTQELAAKAVEGREEARRLREQAAEVATRIEDAVNRMESLRTGDATTKLEAAKSAYETALTSAGRARAGDRSGAALAAGEIQQTLGNMLGTHSAALTIAADILTQIAEARTPLPGAASIQTTAQSYRAQAETARASAVETLVGARESFEGAGLRAEEAERIERINAELDAMIQSLGGPAAEVEAPIEEETFEEEPMGEEPAMDETEILEEEPPAEETQSTDDGEG